MREESFRFILLRPFLFKDLRFYKSAARNERREGDDRSASRHIETSLEVGGETALAAHPPQLAAVVGC